MSHIIYIYIEMDSAKKREKNIKRQRQKKCYHPCVYVCVQRNVVSQARPKRRAFRKIQKTVVLLFVHVIFLLPLPRNWVQERKEDQTCRKERGPTQNAEEERKR